jgi:hypothetical protein
MDMGRIFDRKQLRKPRAREKAFNQPHRISQELLAFPTIDSHRQFLFIIPDWHPKIMTSPDSRIAGKRLLFQIPMCQLLQDD